MILQEIFCICDFFNHVSHARASPLNFTWSVFNLHIRDVNLPLFGGIPLFFLLSAFLKMIFRFFWKIAGKKKPNPVPLGGFQRASVNSHGRLGLPVRAPSVSGQSTKAPISTRHSKSDTRSHAKENRPQNLITYSTSSFEAEGKGWGGGRLGGRGGG